MFSAGKDLADVHPRFHGSTGHTRARPEGRRPAAWRDVALPSPRPGSGRCQACSASGTGGHLTGDAETRPSYRPRAAHDNTVCEGGTPRALCSGRIRDAGQPVHCHSGRFTTAAVPPPNPSRGFSQTSTAWWVTSHLFPCFHPWMPGSAHPSRAGAGEQVGTQMSPKNLAGSPSHSPRPSGHRRN